MPHERNCCIWPNVPFSKVKQIFIWLCPLPFAKYCSPHQIASKKGNCEFKYIKNASGILGKWKLKILHERTYSVQLSSTFYCAKINIYLIVPMTICQIPPTASIWCSVVTAQLITALDGLISRAVAFLQSWKDAATENYAALTIGICTLHSEIF